MTTAQERPDRPLLPQDRTTAIYDRVREKKESYQRYNFERLQEEAFATFFDLAQEVVGIENLYLISVAVPQVFFGLNSRLYAVDGKSARIIRVATSAEGLIPPDKRQPIVPRLSDRPYHTEEAVCFPIRGNEALTKFIPYLSKVQVLGLFEIYPRTQVSERDHFFLEKLANRIGYNLHQKLLIEQNLNHIKFINQLVSDIEHNVISPNLYYRLFLKRLRRNLTAYETARRELEKAILEIEGPCRGVAHSLAAVEQLLGECNQTLEEDWSALTKHYEHTSLFLETLFRRDHFEKGTYVLRRQTCNFRTEIIQPLLERYLPEFEKRSISVDNSLENVPDEQVTLSVDKGLISQVFDNMFSNALKYTQEMEDQLGNPIKFVSYNRQILEDFFGKGIRGVRFNFFTTGQPLTEDEARKIFEEGYRAPGSPQAKGSGHGLHFVRNVVEIHGGVVGCEPQKYGNLIYFVLPLKEAVPEV